MFKEFFIFITIICLILADDVVDSSTDSTTPSSNPVNSTWKIVALFFETIGRKMSSAVKNLGNSSAENVTTVEAVNVTNVSADDHPKPNIFTRFFKSAKTWMADSMNKVKNSTFGSWVAFLRDVYKVDRELLKMNLTMDSLRNLTWKNYTSGPLYDLSKTDAFKNVFGDFSVNSTSFNYSKRIGEEFKPEDFQVMMTGMNLDIKAKHVENRGKYGKTVTESSVFLPLPEEFTMDNIKYEIDDDGKLYVCGDLRQECQITRDPPDESEDSSIEHVRVKHSVFSRDPRARLQSF